MRFPFISRQARLTKAPRRNCLSRQIGRGLEQLEDRRMLSTIPVTLASDAISPIGDGEITLREAISYVNGDFVPIEDRPSFDFANLGTNDTILFNLPPGEDTIRLGIDSAGNPINFSNPPFMDHTGQLSIANSVTIDAGGQGITIDASGNDPTPTLNNGDGSRVFEIHAISAKLVGLGITGGDIDNRGGGIDVDGTGGIFFELLDSDVYGNSSTEGGGIFISGTGSNLATSQVDILRSTIRDNVATEVDGFWGGGGITLYAAPGDVFNVIDSTVSGNVVQDNDGGGIWFCPKGDQAGQAEPATLNLLNSTISGNSALGHEGGGLWTGLDLAGFPSDVVLNIDSSTFTDNAASVGGGLFSEDVSGVGLLSITTTLNNTIVSGNRDAAPANSAASNIGGIIELVSSFNLIGPGEVTAAALNASSGIGNIDDPGNNPGLQPLGDYGGPTETHLPLATSLVVDAGDPSIVFDPLVFDQRGDPFARVADGNGTLRVDIGAVELQSPPSGDLPPSVIEVIISNSNSLAHPAYNFATATVADLDTGNIEPVVGSGNQLRTVPVGGANTVEIVFSEPVDNTDSTLENSLTVAGLTTFNSGGITKLAPASFSYDSLSNTAKWTFVSWNVADFYRISLDDAVTDLDGKALDGEWSNPTSIETENAAVSEFPSGNSEEGGDFHFVVTMLAGDASLDNIVNGTDFDIFLYSYLAGLDDALFTDGDADGNGVIDAADFAIIDQLNWNLNFQFVWVLGDLNGDLVVTIEIDGIGIFENFGPANPNNEKADLNGDGQIDMDDIDLAMEQLELGIDWVF